ncbi:putative membrane protein [Planoprotostelium fungivorum]|uniref:Putative membrane protein n=1 Tax=Planoprotostelium fungivorum TaxID=1890364 RepID=A0A2P6N0J0_9EUKA|nr:putative membrane protein [Planoprotostelium fungivorum]
MSSSAYNRASLPPAAPGTIEGPITIADAATTSRILSEFGMLPTQTNQGTFSSQTVTYPVEQALAQPLLVRETVIAQPIETIAAQPLAAPLSAQPVLVEKTVLTQAPAQEVLAEPIRTIEAWVKGRLLWKRRTLSIQNQYLYTRKKANDEFYERRMDLTYSTFAAEQNSGKKKNGLYIDNPVTFNRIKLAFDDQKQMMEWATLMMLHRQQQLTKLGAIQQAAPTVVTQPVAQQPIIMQGYNNDVIVQGGYSNVMKGYSNPTQGYSNVQGYNNNVQGYNNNVQGYNNVAPVEGVYNNNMRSVLEQDLLQRQIMEKLHQENMNQAINGTALPSSSMPHPVLTQ